MKVLLVTHRAFVSAALMNRKSFCAVLCINWLSSSLVAGSRDRWLLWVVLREEMATACRGGLSPDGSYSWDLYSEERGKRMAWWNGLRAADELGSPAPVEAVDANLTLSWSQSCYRLDFSWIWLAFFCSLKGKWLWINEAGSRRSSVTTADTRPYIGSLGTWGPGAPDAGMKCVPETPAMRAEAGIC